MIRDYVRKQRALVKEIEELRKQNAALRQAVNPPIIVLPPGETTPLVTLGLGFFLGRLLK